MGLAGSAAALQARAKLLHRLSPARPCPWAPGHWWVPRGDTGNSQAKNNSRHLPWITPCQGGCDPSNQQGTGVSSPGCWTAMHGPELPHLPGLAEASKVPPAPKCSGGRTAPACCWADSAGFCGRAGCLPLLCSAWTLLTKGCWPGRCGSQAVNMCHGCDLLLPACCAGWATRSPVQTLRKALGTGQDHPIPTCPASWLSNAAHPPLPQGRSSPHTRGQVDVSITSDHISLWRYFSSECCKLLPAQGGAFWGSTAIPSGSLDLMGPAASCLCARHPGPSFPIIPQQGLLTPCRLAGCSGGLSWESQEGKSFWGL